AAGPRADPLPQAGSPPEQRRHALTAPPAPVVGGTHRRHPASTAAPASSREPAMRSLPLLLFFFALSGCAALAPRDPLRIDLAGLEPLPAQGMEMRFALLLRVQNPNDNAIDYDGLSVELEVNGQPLASGV